MRNALVLMMATTFFTRNSPTTGAILHGDDREEADVKARFPLVSEADADYLESEKLAERYDGKVPEEGVPGSETVNERAGRMADEHMEADQSVEQPTGLDTRGSTAFERPVEELAGSAGSSRRMIDTGAEAPSASEEDAPASGKSKSGKAAAKSE